MTRNVVIFALALGVLIGLGAGIFLTGHASAHGPGPRYEYECLTKVPTRIWKDEALDELNRMGSRGWRLLPHRYAGGTAGGFGGSYQDVYCFERRY